MNVRAIHPGRPSGISHEVGADAVAMLPVAGSPVAHRGRQSSPG